ncbi:MAG: Fis family transcriptional regulator [Thiocapsa sp.]|jgi:Fis family transcriptional regulator|nr:helix-turn-helix domain-containing protein [Thiocapsa sp.]MCG6895595.1 Fis family transcriptional regulator [Thiocapsa sp.]MCG6985926.1 Fis family transcriptional regulator [Thiocapsa sp.]
MKTAALDSVKPSQSTELKVVEADRTDPLSKCVQDALGFYLENMAGHQVSNLYELVIEEVERPLFETVLKHTNGNLSLAAKMLGLTRATLRKRLRGYGIARDR